MRTVDLRRYEGLVFKTATMYEGMLGIEREDLQQIFRVRVWKAVEAHDPSRSSQGTLDTFVFYCLRNQVKDLIKAKVRRDRHGSQVYIEDFALNSSLENPTTRDRFEAAHLATQAHEVDEVRLPASLTRQERQMVALLYVGYRQGETAELLGIDGDLVVQRRVIERLMRSIRKKLDGWNPKQEGGEVISLVAEAAEVSMRVAA